LTEHRLSLEEGSASTKLHGSAGTAFGSGNAIVDEAFPISVTYRADVTGLVATASFQLPGTYYIG
jgi:hypothetical protein